jgi:hypothetical protein
MRVSPMWGVLCTSVTTSVKAFSASSDRFFPSSQLFSSDNNEWTSDFDDFVGNDDDSMKISSIFKTRGSKDLSATQSRQFSLGRDLILADFVGNMGFDEVTDWEYYYENEEGPVDRKVVQPNPFDASKPKRTRTKSGSVVSYTICLVYQKRYCFLKNPYCIRSECFWVNLSDDLVSP